MDNVLLQKLLFVQVRSGKPVDITVEGVSMQPTLTASDVVTLVSREEYDIGDILVFTYKQEGLLIHRLLDKQEGRYFCKGDNAFRLEDITQEQIVGKVIAVNSDPLPSCPSRLATLSYLVNRAFVRCRYDVEKTKQTEIYGLYKKSILNKGDSIMIYQKNNALNYIQTDDTSLAVYDPESGDTHFFDETGIDILNSLAEPCDMDGLLNKLCQIYDAAPEDIRGDVEEFLQEAISRKVVKVL